MATSTTNKAQTDKSLQQRVEINESTPVNSSLVGKLITSEINIPTISVGGGRYTTGQCLVYHDMLGLTPSNKPPPSFVKKYADLGCTIRNALQNFKNAGKKIIVYSEYELFTIPIMRLLSAHF